MTTPAQSLLHSLAQAFDMTLAEGETSLTLRKGCDEDCEYSLVVAVSTFDDGDGSDCGQEWTLKDSEIDRVFTVYSLSSAIQIVGEFMPDPRLTSDERALMASPRYH